MAKSVNKWVLLAYMKAGYTRHIGPFKTRALAQAYAKRIFDLASYEVEVLLKPFD